MSQSYWWRSLDPHVPKVCRSECVVIATLPKQVDRDAPVPNDHFYCALRIAGRRVRAAVIDALWKMPLAKLQGRLAAACPGVRRPSSYRARATIANDHEQVDGLITDVLIELSLALKKPVGVRAAVPAINAWIDVAAYRIVKRRARSAMLLTLLASPSDEPLVAVVDPAVAPLVFAANDNGLPADDLRARFQLIVSSDPGVMETLTSLEREAFSRWVGGAEPAAIARELGVEPSVVRLRLHHARRRIEANKN